nr:hypothetical protein [Anaerobacillus isosaccharinicus]QOY38700.1 hypothetical protein AWH56_020585 [Anaerobacillus isosaccharinicus]
MSKTTSKKYFIKLLILLLGAFIIYSIYIHLEYRNYINQSIDRNYDSFWSISHKGSNLADRLEDFIQLPIEKEDISEVKSELYNNWRIVNGESRSILSDLSAISTLHMGDSSSDWGLLRYSLFRIDYFISGMTDKFLEHYSYVISIEEKQKMEAVITVFRTISEENDNELVDIEIILQSIKEPMLIIDHNYSGTLERIGKKD